MLDFLKKKKKYDFDDDDREAAVAMRALKKEQRRIEIENMRAEIKQLRRRAPGERTRQDSPGSLLRKFQELDELRDYLTPQQQEEVAKGGIEAWLPILMQMQQVQSGAQGVAQTPEELKSALKTQGKRQKNADSTQLIISKIPPALRSQIEKGRIPKTVAQKYARDLADKEFEKVWKRLSKH